MNSICILTAGRFPVPVSEGGAVESLVDIMIESYQMGSYDFKLDIISVDSNKSQILSYNYPKAKFIYIKPSKIYQYLYKKVRYRYVKWFGHIPYRLCHYLVNAGRLISKGDYDVIIVENRPEFIPYLRTMCSSKIASHLHNDFVNSSINESISAAYNSDLIITVSDFIKRRVETISDLTIPVISVPNVIDCSRFSEKLFSHRERNALRKSFGVTNDDILCIFVGRLDPTKGIDKLVEAIHRIQADNIKLLIVGASFYATSIDTPFSSKLKALIDSCNKRVYFSGYIDNNDLYKYYKSADIAVVPSQWEEPAGLVAIEAQACSLPLIASQSGGLPEYTTKHSTIFIERGEDYVSNLADAIAFLSRNVEDRKKMGEAGRINAANYDKQHYLEDMLKALEVIDG